MRAYALRAGIFCADIVDAARHFTPRLVWRLVAGEEYRQLPIESLTIRRWPYSRLLYRADHCLASPRYLLLYCFSLAATAFKEPIRATRLLRDARAIARHDGISAAFGSADDATVERVAKGAILLAGTLLGADAAARGD